MNVNFDVKEYVPSLVLIDFEIDSLKMLLFLKY